MKNELSQNSTVLLCDKKTPFFLYQTPSYRTDKKEK